MRTAEITRKTAETDISLLLNLDGTGVSAISSGVGFFDHMLELFSRHGRFDIDLVCKGDTNVDNHHTIEDIGICLGKAFAQALGDARGIYRYSDITLPMDETLVLCAIDISGRGHLSFNVKFPETSHGAMDTELLEEFFLAFVRNSGVTVHVKLIDGNNSHHIIEACFKAFARALGAATAIDNDYKNEIPSTKGTLI